MVPQNLSGDLLYQTFLVFVLLVLAGEAKEAKRYTHNYIDFMNRISKRSSLNVYKPM